MKAERAINKLDKGYKWVIHKLITGEEDVWSGIII